MKIETFIHEDDRRTLIEFVNDKPLRTMKAMYVKGGVLGSHYHKLKDDVFFLVTGFGTYTVDGKTNIFREGDCLEVKAGFRHSFNLKEGSILLEASTLPYDKEDEYFV